MQEVVGKQVRRILENRQVRQEIHALMDRLPDQDEQAEEEKKRRGEKGIEITPGMYVIVRRAKRAS